MKKFILLLAFFVLSACDDSSSAGGDNGSGENRGGIPDIVETFMELSDYDCGKSQKCVATYLTEYHNMAVCDGDNGWVIGTLIEKMDCDFSSSSAKVTDKDSDAKSSDSKSTDPAGVTDKSSDSKDNLSSAGTSTKSSNSNTSGNDAKSSSSAGKVESSSSSDEVPKSYAEAKVMPSGTYDCTKYKCVTTEYLNQEFLEAGKYGEILDERDGQVYKTISIGVPAKDYSEVWMAQNLNYQTENSWCGGGIHGTRTAGDCSVYGRLYTWVAAIGESEDECGYGYNCTNPDTGPFPSVSVQGICPDGWHVPISDELIDLAAAVGGDFMAGQKLKTQAGWAAYSGGVIINEDAYGFSALPAGYRHSGGLFYGVGYSASFWSASWNDNYYAYDESLDFSSDEANLNFPAKNNAYSVRCVKDSN